MAVPLPSKQVSPVRFWILALCLLGLAVKTSLPQSENRSSNLLEDTCPDGLSAKTLVLQTGMQGSIPCQGTRECSKTDMRQASNLVMRVRLLPLTLWVRSSNRESVMLAP